MGYPGWVVTDYSPEDVGRILGIYRTLFPHIDGVLADYWDFHRERELSFLTTDFRYVDFSAIQSFDVTVRQLEGEILGRYSRSELIELVEIQIAVARRYRELAKTHHMGYSLGISPITDDLLLRTFSDSTSRIVIVLGHDWYPIVTTSPDGRNPFLPIPALRRYSVLSERNYEPAIHPLMQAKDCAILFLNLYPDFRGPGVNKLGSLGDYTPWVRGFAAVCESVMRSFKLIGVISWGRHVWEAFQKKLATPFRHMRIMAAVKELHKQRTCFSLPLGAVTVPYYPFAHPSFGTNFKNKDHWATYKDVCSRLIL